MSNPLDDLSKSSVRYTDIVFMDGEEGARILDIINEKGEIAAVEYLTQWDYGEAGETRTELGAGSHDTRFDHDGYALTYNQDLGYAALARIEENPTQSHSVTQSSERTGATKPQNTSDLLARLNEEPHKRPTKKGHTR